MPIFDQGYQHWQGELRGHTWRWWAVTREGVRRQMSGWLVRSVLILAWIPAILLAAVLAIWGLVEQKSEIVQPILSMFALPTDLTDNPGEYRVAVWTLAYDYFFRYELFFAMILVVLIGPGLISKDLRYNALPLYLSRPVTRLDYFLGKFGVIAVCLGMVAILPAAVAWLLGVLFSMDASVLVDTLPVLGGALLNGLVIVLSAGTLMLALSSLSRNSRYVAAMWIGVWFVSNVVAGVATGIHMGLQMQEAGIFQPQPPTTTEVDSGDEKDAEKAARRAEREARARQQEMNTKMQDILTEATRDNWRVMFSYTGNLDRVKAVLLDTNSAWDHAGQMVFMGPPSQDDEGAEEPFFITERKGPQYPWYWSGLLLVVLAGVSVGILHFRVRSLDRLK